MQGKKDYQEKLFTQFQLSEYVPKENFYRRLKEVLDLKFLYKMTQPYYGDCGQKSIDPVVFFKLCLIGYLENIISHRKLIEHSKMRLDILYFLGYDIDEPLPWHSTVSRTRLLFPEKVFEEVFTVVLTMCINKGMVSGHTQVLDSAPVKANASMDSLELKVPEQELEDHLHQIRHISRKDREEYAYRKAKNDKASNAQKTITANEKELQAINSRNKKWSKDQDHRPGAQKNNSKYTSNKTHYSPTDPDARISVKPGKARKLNYLSQLTVDSSHHVITDIRAYHADGKDNQYLQDIVLRLKKRLWSVGLYWENLLADTGYSSGENYQFLEDHHIISYIPPHGTYKGGPEGFVYNEEEDNFVCSQGKVIPFVKYFLDSRTKTRKKEYRARKSVCIGCALRAKCLGKSQEKRITITAYRAEYERNNERVNSPLGRQLKYKRQSTVEPVFGTLTQYMGMRKINTIGIKQANKVMHLAAIAYNIKKYLKFEQKFTNTNRDALISSKLFSEFTNKLELAILGLVYFKYRFYSLI
jgi:transposase